jgi:hypothetical protein
MAQIFTLKQLWNKQLKEYKKQQHKFLLTSRFNMDTWSQNVEYRKTHKSIGCIYCSPDPISQHIPTESIMFILEMNNDTNKIMGIGMVRNKPNINKYRVYTEGNYNRYVYVGSMRIGREEMDIEEDKIMQVFDVLCFKGNKHMKRGQGLKSFPTDMLFRCSRRLDLVEFISKMFKKRLT